MTPAFIFAGLALEPNEAGDLTLLETEDKADSEAVRKLFFVPQNVTAKAGIPRLDDSQQRPGST